MSELSRLIQLGGGPRGLQGDDGAAGGGDGGLTLTTGEIDLGSVPRRSGRFIISGSGLTVGKPALVLQAHGPYTGKGTRADEAQMDRLMVTGKVISTTQVECFWNSTTRVRGNFKFDAAVSA